MSERVLKPAKVHALGASIEVLDAETGASLGFEPIPRKGKPGAWCSRMVEKYAGLGYELRTCPSMAGGDARSLVIG